MPPLDELEEDDPLPEGLDLLGRFARGVARVPWFAHVGARFDAGLKRDAAAYLDALGFPDVALTRLATWADAAAAAETLDWDSPAWEAEEQLRAALSTEAEARFGEEALAIALAHIGARAARAAEIGVTRAAALGDVHDEGLLTAATGAAVQAAHQAALLLAAGGETNHPLAIKFRLFQQGRWPIGIAGLSFNVF